MNIPVRLRSRTIVVYDANFIAGIKKHFPDDKFLQLFLESGNLRAQAYIRILFRTKQKYVQSARNLYFKKGPLPPNLEPMRSRMISEIVQEETRLIEAREFLNESAIRYGYQVRID